MSSRPHLFIYPTDREGFEPSIRFEPYTHFPGVRLEPLGHLSKVVAGEEVRPSPPPSQRIISASPVAAGTQLRRTLPIRRHVFDTVALLTPAKCCSGTSFDTERANCRSGPARIPPDAHVALRRNEQCSAALGASLRLAPWPSRPVPPRPRPCPTPPR